VKKMFTTVAVCQLRYHTHTETKLDMFVNGIESAVPSITHYILLM
jgi:hypothetical protein